jgi:predicted AAA+ superfamily ATPase
MQKRILSFDHPESESCFLWGPRQSGKTTLLGQVFPEAKRYDLLLAEEYRRLLANPAIVREECLAEMARSGGKPPLVIIDEIQKLPELLDECHWLIVNKGVRFILCGSSARKLKRQHGNLLGGRALRYELHPFVTPELEEFDLPRALNHGLLPRHYLMASPGRALQAYVGDYLKEEIQAEALTRNVPAFSRFLEVAALSNGEMINYTNIAAETGVSAPTVKEYFQILEDTLIGTRLPAFRKRAKRRTIQAPRFYFFDVGVVAALTRRGKVEPGSELFGRAFEHFIHMEILAHSHYSKLFYPLTYWRTTSGFEVDFVLGDHEVAVEVKSTESARNSHLKGLRAFRESHMAKRNILVSRDPNPRLTEDGIEILPWTHFLDRLWSNDLI